MEIEIIHMLDPEIVNPAHPHSNSLDFWNRMLKWSAIDELRLGPATLAALGRLAAAPPNVAGLAVHDFWTIVGRFSSRAITPAAAHQADEMHLRSAYAPHWGAGENFTILIEDLKTVGAGCEIALASEILCWHSSCREACNDCLTMGLHRVYTSRDPEYSRHVARAWRRAYRQKATGDFEAMKKLSKKLFPAIEFSSTAWERVGTLSGSESEATNSVLNHLSVLNDHAAAIWKGKVSRPEREAALGSMAVSASMEGPRTHKNKAAMKTRDFAFSAGTVRCEWHTKVKPNTDRIYFEIQGESIFVGAIVDHLPT